MIKLKSLIMEFADLPPPAIKFDIPAKSDSQSSKHYSASSFDFSKKSDSKNSQDPSFEEYFQHLKDYEGYRKNPYKDSVHKFVTVGIGHKFEKGERIKSEYSDSEIRNFFKSDLDDAIRIAKSNFNNFDSLPKGVKVHLVSLAFNLGKGGIRKFVDFKGAIQKKDFKTAAKELKDSIWYNQVGRRAKDYVNFFNSVV